MAERRRELMIGLTGTAQDLVDDLADLDRALTGVPYALVGGLAVLVHAPGHRVTQDVDTAIRESRHRMGPILRVVATKPDAGDHEWLLGNATPVDVLPVMQRDPTPGRLGQRRNAKELSLRWAVSTAQHWDVHAANGIDQRARVPVATRAALLALKTVAVNAPDRGDKRGSDLLDIWTLLRLDFVPAASGAEEATMAPLVQAPGPVRTWVADTLHGLMVERAAEFVLDAAPSAGGPTTAEDLEELHAALVAPVVADWL